MNHYLHELAASPLVNRVCWALLHSLWQGAAVVLLILVARWLVRGSSAAARHGVTMFGLLVLGACPVVTFMRLGVEPVPVIAASDPVTLPDLKIIPAPVLSPVVESTISQPVKPTVRITTPRVRHHLRWELWVVSAWLVGLAVLTLWHGVGWMLLQRLRRVGISPLSPALEEMVTRLSRMMGLRRPMIVRWSDRVRSPATFGWWRPVILLPLSLASGLSARQWEMILMHELAHLRRHDYLVNLLQTAVETLMFYHPATWWISRQIRREREHACDDAAARLSGDSLAYAGALTKLAEMELSYPCLALGAGGAQREFYRRITRILRPAPRRVAWKPLLGGVATAAFVTFVVLGYTARTSLAQNKGKAAAANAEAVRGDIRDRNGVVLATSDRVDRQIVFDMDELVSAWRAEHGDVFPTYAEHYAGKESDPLKGTLDRRERLDLAAMMDDLALKRLTELGLARSYNREAFNARCSWLKTGGNWKPRVKGMLVVYHGEMTPEELVQAEGLRSIIPSLKTRIVELRRYPLQAAAAHLLGYVGLQHPANAGMVGMDSVKGRSGAEAVWDDQLKEKAAPGSAGIRGDDIYLTLDARHQMIAEQALRDAGVGRGAVVLLDVKTSDVLAMASLPSFDPNDFIPSIPSEKFKLLAEDRTYPLTNRAVAAYAPGSAYMTVTTLAAACAGHEKDSYTCNGSVQYGSKNMRCWISVSGGKHGPMTLSEGLVNSCGCYAFQLGVATGIEQIDSVGELIGLGRKSGIGLHEEAAGILPGPEWLKEHAQRFRWTDSQTANVAIGQGYVLATPLQMAGVMSTIANDGVVWRPRLLDKTVSVADQSTKTEPRIRKADLREHGLTAGGLEMIRKGLYDSVFNENGKAREAASQQIHIAGKTGSAEYWRPDGGKDNRTNFICYAPADKPRWALAVFVEGAKSGGAVAAPIARRILEQIAAVEAGRLKVEIKPMPPAKGHLDPIDAVRFPEEAK